MDKDHLPLLEDQNPLRRSEIFAGTRSETLALTEAIKACRMSQGVKRTLNLLKAPENLLPSCLALLGFPGRGGSVRFGAGSSILYFMSEAFLKMDGGILISRSACQ
ncbi:hypothetical protein Q3V30_22340 (plasmid) [Erwinia pyri]|uniref:Uncharacterized protein n=1 Tax=Erwinia pyri TaxID=3062598 RepID=A0AA50DNL4_9GAMM|nr:hypothetical protein [Erwinia sp. DE2]WLS81206.1 hypothetical protein Q3V30_22340 [Erwinia sp. DE2]